MDNGVTRRLGGDKPRHYIFDQAYGPDSRRPPLRHKGYGRHAGVSAAAERRAASQMVEETLEKRISIMNSAWREPFVEWSILKKTERSETALRHSIFDILRFCGSLFNI